MKNVLLLLGLLALAPAAWAQTTIGELVSVQGAPPNQLFGYGLVVGLPGTGDQTTQVPYTQQAILNMLRNMGVAMNNVSTMMPQDVASVMVTAEVPAFAHQGQKIDVTVSAVGNAASLAGGVLLPTPLRGGNGNIYAQAQGPLLVSGFAAGAGGTSTKVNVPTTGTLPGGAILASSIPANFAVNGMSALLVDDPSFQTAQRIADTINRAFGPNTANAVSPGEVDVTAAAGASPVGFMADLLALPITAPQPEPLIIVDAQSGTIVMNEGVTLGPAVVSHGDLTVSIQTQNAVSQPGPFSNGTTVGVRNTAVSAKQSKAQVIMLPHAATLQQVAAALNAVGASPQDLIAIIEALKEAGAIKGRIKVI
ncbi:flagellar P-ring protein flgI [Acidocella sp. MX-AZ02]|nr:flagellar P-ring protein flgI [Acidocella sp. MX-AZ02]